jgi:cytoskeletal protein CcmA (bactofilin family)
MFDKRKDSSQEGPKAHFDAGLSDLTSVKNTAQSSGRTAVIGPRIVINGSITGDESLVVEGRVEGNIDLGGHRVEVGPSGQVKADIEAKEVKIDGEVRGDISGSEKVIISRTGRVQGNIKAPRMTLEDGAKFKGSIDMDPDKAEKPVARPAVQPAAEAKPQPKPAANGTGQPGQPAVADKAKASPGLNLENK